VRNIYTNSSLWRRVIARRQSQFLILSTLSVCCLPITGVFSNVLHIAAAAAVHKLVTKDNDKTNNIISATRNLLFIIK
jgi:hypothetical protein